MVNSQANSTIKTTIDNNQDQSSTIDYQEGSHHRNKRKKNNSMSNIKN